MKLANGTLPLNLAREPDEYASEVHEVHGLGKNYYWVTS